MRKELREKLERYVPGTMPQAIRDVSNHKASTIEGLTKDLSPTLVKRCQSLATAIRKEGEGKANWLSNALKKERMPTSSKKNFKKSSPGFAGDDSPVGGSERRPRFHNYDSM